MFHQIRESAFFVRNFYVDPSDEINESSFENDYSSH